MIKQIKSKARVADHGEVFTAKREVDAMLDLVKQETERVDSRFLEPACGDGNFVAGILRRKLVAAKKRAIPPRKKKPLPLEFEKQSVIAVASIYGVDLMMDNVNACRRRLYDIWNDEYEAICKNEADDECREAVKFILRRNIVCGNALTLMDIVKKLLTGATDEENARNKARMRELFNECVPEGDQYTLIYCHMEDFTDAVVVKVTTHSNFIVGYKPGEVVVVPVDAELKGHEEPVVFNKENGGQIKSTLVGYCTASKPDVTFQFEPITYEPGIKRGSKYAVSVTQSHAEVSAFRKFFKQGL